MESDDSASSADSSNCVEPKPSQLGCRNYWEHFYGQELANCEAAGDDNKEADDQGEIWFGAAAEQRLVNYAERWFAELDASQQQHGLVVVDIGCGNGHLALRLAADKQLSGLRQVLCLDYSSPAVELTRRLAVKASVSHVVSAHLLDVTEPGAAAAMVKLLQSIANPSDSTSNGNPNLLLLDKGTYDAISLCPDDSPGKRLAYRKFVAEFLDSVNSANARLVLASCNWTESELLAQFAEFRRVETLPGRAFRFGGSVGSDVTTLVFARLMPGEFST